MLYKLLFITYTHSGGGGAENVLTTLVNQLDSNTYKIDIVEVNQFSVKKEPLRHEVSLLEPFVRMNDVRTNAAINYILYEHPEIIKPLFRLYDYDIVISWNYQLPSFCLRAFKNEKKIAWFHGDIYNFLPNTIDFKPEKYKILQRKAWETADRIVTISQNSLQSLKDIFPEFEKKTEILYNGYDIPKIKNLSSMEIIQKIPNTDNIIIGIGRLDKNKNFEMLIRAAGRLMHSGIECFLIILGKGELLHELEHIVRQEKIEGHVLFAGYQENPYPFLKRAKIVCLSSFAEGFPTVMIEGMILGKPFVTTPVISVGEEFADNNKCGFVTGWGIEEYAHCIKKLLEDNELYNKMSQNCLEYAENLSVQHWVSNFDSLIRRVSLSNMEEAAKNTQTIEKQQRFKAVCIFAFAFAIQQYFQCISEDLLRLKGKHGMINIMKITYHSILFSINLLILPFSFFTGLIKTALFNRRITGNFS